MKHDQSARINPTWTIHELLECCPESAPLLRSFGIDGCCGGYRTISEAAKSAHVDAPTLLRVLDEVIVGCGETPTRR